MKIIWRTLLYALGALVVTTSAFPADSEVTLEGPNVVRFADHGVKFIWSYKYLYQGKVVPGGCASSHIRHGSDHTPDVLVTIELARDSVTCQSLIETGEPVDKNIINRFINEIDSSLPESHPTQIGYSASKSASSSATTKTTSSATAATRVSHEYAIATTYSDGNHPFMLTLAGLGIGIEIRVASVSNHIWWSPSNPDVSPSCMFDYWGGNWQEYGESVSAGGISPFEWTLEAKNTSIGNDISNAPAPCDMTKMWHESTATMSNNKAMPLIFDCSADINIIYSKHGAYGHPQGQADLVSESAVVGTMKNCGEYLRRAVAEIRKPNQPYSE